MMRLLWAIAFWVFLALFFVDMTSPSYTNAENSALLCLLFRYCWVTEYNPVDD
jgi:hypothetical protein